MSEVAAIKCDGDGCTQVKGDTNSWIVIRRGKDGWFKSHPMDSVKKRRGDKHFCGLTCSVREYSQYLNKILYPDQGNGQGSTHAG